MDLSSLPPELICEIAKALRSTSDRNADMRSFLLVNRQLYEQGHRVFYKNIVLTNFAIRKFPKSFNIAKFGALVRSLTVRVEERRYDTFGCTKACGSKWFYSLHSTRISLLIPPIRQMTNLVSMSLRVEEVYPSTLVDLLRSLPENCVNLDIDSGTMKGYEGDTRRHLMEEMLMERMLAAEAALSHKESERGPSHSGSSRRNAAAYRSEEDEAHTVRSLDNLEETLAEEREHISPHSSSFPEAETASQSVKVEIDTDDSLDSHHYSSDEREYSSLNSKSSSEAEKETSNHDSEGTKAEDEQRIRRRWCDRYDDIVDDLESAEFVRLDHRDPDAELAAHPCDAIRQLLPRMRNLRIQMSPMCPNIIGGTEDDEFKPVARDHKTRVTCGLLQQNKTYIPFPYTYMWFRDQRKEKRAFTLANETSLAGARIYATAANDVTNYGSVHMHVDMMRKETLAFPIRKLDEDGTCLIRPYNDAEFMTPPGTNLESITKGFVWNDVIGGARLPVSMLDADENCSPRPMTKLDATWQLHRDLVYQHEFIKSEEGKGSLLMVPQNVCDARYADLDFVLSEVLEDRGALINLDL
ncbi:hypothetical protein M011DRAFT_459282 [Sporormia fimetaria CBS 119925]|uniref:Uncharacterized protein n=1 Tax=Sporormia fimetaria CBS 119925 TaxID=1340428 RepID=A0A6A6V9X7_9PLEO|nr:hypothetical protein M011DRAFT_459282 [Sporormia fimetaria CBS 119925]